MLDGLQSVCVLAEDPNAVEMLRQRIEQSLVKAVAQQKRFIRMSFSSEEQEYLKGTLEMVVELTQQRPLLDELNEAFTRLIAMESPTEVIGAGIEQMVTA